MRISNLIKRLSAIKEQEGDLTVVMDCGAEGPNCGSFTMAVPSPTVITVEERSVEFTRHTPGETVWDLVSDKTSSLASVREGPWFGGEVHRVVTVGV